MPNLNKLSKALVLGGGGITGIAWELGIVLGLKEGGVDVTNFDLIVGTSAGSNVGAMITSGLTLEEHFNLLLKFAVKIQSSMKSDNNEFGKIMLDAIRNSQDPQKARANIGKAALAADTISEEEYLKTISALLPQHEWNKETRLVINAVDAESGEWVTFDRDSGVPLLLALMASSAVPGVYPPTTINKHRYIDGGMSSRTNADVAKDEDLVLILSTEPGTMTEQTGHMTHRITFEEELQVLKDSGAKILVITPDEESLLAKGDNPMNPEKLSPSAHAGLRQGKLLINQVEQLFKD